MHGAREEKEGALRQRDGTFVWYEMRWSGEVVPRLESSLLSAAQAGGLVCVTISALCQGCGGRCIGLPRKGELVKVHVRSGDDL
eukprot:4194064-Pleurochrysis_carterae.AAC.1